MPFSTLGLIRSISKDADGRENPNHRMEATRALIDAVRAAYSNVNLSSVLQEKDLSIDDK